MEMNQYTCVVNISKNACCLTRLSYLRLFQRPNMLLSLWIVTSSLVVASFGSDVDFSMENACYPEGESMKLIAVYKGNGTVSAVQWYYSNKTANNLLVLPGPCNVAGGVPDGYPDISRMKFTCDVGNNTYTLTLSNLEEDEFGKSWGATFSLSVGSSPDLQKGDLIICLTTTTAKSSTTTTFTTKKTTPSTTTSTMTTTTKTTTTVSTTTSTIHSVTSTYFSKTSVGQSTAQSLSSDGLSKEILIVIILVPTVLTLMGIIIISCICYFKQSKERLPAGHQHHRIGTYNKGNKHPVLEETYLSYGIHYTGQSNHKETNSSSHYGKVKQNPLYRASKERVPYMLYNTGALLRHEAYRPSYTKEHVYPAKTSGYHYGPDYHDKKRRRGNPHFISYPGYSRHQQYGNPSFSYPMEY